VRALNRADARSRLPGKQHWGYHISAVVNGRRRPPEHGLRARISHQASRESA